LLYWYKSKNTAAESVGRLQKGPQTLVATNTDAEGAGTKVQILTQKARAGSRKGKINYQQFEQYVLKDYNKILASSRLISSSLDQPEVRP
jgi:hypothetical protein